jgi:hypothetical protein
MVSILFYILLIIIIGLLLEPEKKVQFTQVENKYHVFTKDSEMVVEKADVIYYKSKFDEVTKEYNNRKKLYPTTENARIEVPEYELQPIFQDLMREFDNGSQSVHDTVIQNQLKNQYSQLNTNKSQQNLISDIVEYSKKELPKDSEKIENILNSINSRNSTLTSLDGDTEMNAISKVWNTEDPDIRRQLLNELMDCKSGNGIYCPTGVATRVVNAINIKNPENMAKTQNVLHNEMLQIASNFRNTLEANGEYSEENFAPSLRKHIYSHYEGFISQDKLDKEMNDWIDHI